MSGLNIIREEGRPAENVSLWKNPLIEHKQTELTELQGDVRRAGVSTSVALKASEGHGGTNLGRFENQRYQSGNHVCAWNPAGPESQDSDADDVRQP